MMEIPKVERKKGTEEIYETIMTENFLKLMSSTIAQIQKDLKHQAGSMSKDIT